VPQNGDVNKKLGVYRSLCCGAEIVIAVDAAFPDCPNHPKLSTEWKPLVDPDRRIPHASELRDDSAA
jgi:hypothetical protein